MIAVSALDLFTAAEIDTEGGTEKGRFDIMGHDGVATEDYLDIATTNQVGNVTTGAGVNDGRAKHKENLAVARTCLFHLTSNFVDRQHLDSFPGNITLHETKRSPFARSLNLAHA